MSYKKIRWIRKLESLGIILFALMYYFTNLYIPLIILSSLLIIFFSFYLLINYSGYNNGIIRFFLKLFPRKEEEKKSLFPSDIIFFISTIILLLIFPKDIAIYSIIILAFCDVAEQVFGIKYKIKNLPWNKEKNLAGLIGGFVAAILIGYLTVIVLNFENISSLEIIISSLIASLMGTFKKYDNEAILFGVSLTLVLLRSIL